jgi:hypothetical protein
MRQSIRARLHFARESQTPLSAMLDQETMP